MAHPSTKQLAEALKLRKLIDQLETQIDNAEARLQSILGGGARKKPGRPAKKKAGRPRKTRAPRKGSQKELVHEVLRDAGKPLHADEILERLSAKGYKSKAKDAKKTLGVMLYTDKAIKRAGRGIFKLGGRAAPKAKAKAKRAAKKK